MILILCSNYSVLQCSVQLTNSWSWFFRWFVSSAKSSSHNIVVLHWATNTFFFLQISSIPALCHPGSFTQYHSFRITALSWISIKITLYTGGTYWCSLVYASMNRGSVLRQSLMITTIVSINVMSHTWVPNDLLDV